MSWFSSQCSTSPQTRKSLAIQCVKRKQSKSARSLLQTNAVAPSRFGTLPHQVQRTVYSNVLELGAPNYSVVEPLWMCDQVKGIKDQDQQQIMGLRMDWARKTRTWKRVCTSCVGPVVSEIQKTLINVLQLGVTILANTAILMIYYCMIHNVRTRFPLQITGLRYYLR